MKIVRLFSGLAFALAPFHVSSPSHAADWPQFRGPSRDNVSREAGLLKSWPEGGPKRLWFSTKLGGGYSGPAIVGGKIYIASLRENAEWLLCFDVKDGHELWATRVGDAYLNEFGDGPRGAPTVSDRLVFTLGGKGELLCADASSGKEHWRAKLIEMGGSIPGWGYSESPLVDGARVLVTPGGEKGAVAALDAASGRVLWQSKDFTDEAQYTSLMTLEKDGVRQIISGNRERVAGLAADDGRLLWQEKFRSGVVVSQSPIVSGDQIYTVAAGGTGCKAVRLTAPDTAEVVYANKVMKNLPGGVVLFDGHVYGYSDSIGWVCQNWETGDEVWSSKTLDKGTLTIADGLMYCLTEDKGIVALAEASPKGWKELSRFTLAPQSQRRALKGKVWTPPVIANGRLYLRDQENLFCYGVAAPGTRSP